MEQKVHKNSTELVLCCRLLLATGPALRCGFKCRKAKVEKTNFSLCWCYELQIAFWLELGAHVCLPFSALGPYLA